MFNLYYSLDIFFFFFSSRRRHTRCSRDWSSDVCSSDLTNIVGRTIALGLQNVSQAASITSNQAEQAVKNLGLYGQEELLAASQRLLLTLGIRGDRSSVNGDHKKYFVYPKGQEQSLACCEQLFLAVQPQV